MPAPLTAFEMHAHDIETARRVLESALRGCRGPANAHDMPLTIASIQRLPDQQAHPAKSNRDRTFQAADHARRAA